MKNLARDLYASLSISFFIVHAIFILKPINGFTRPQQIYSSIGFLILSALFAIAYSIENKKL